MRLILLVTACFYAVACSDDPTPSDIVTCDAAWTSQNNGCERACNPKVTAMGPTCLGSNPVGLQRTCGETFTTADGAVGCCIYTTDPNNSSETIVRFYECQ